MPVKLAEVMRSEMVESVHRGDVVVANSNGEILLQLGDAKRFTFLRSSAKPLQAMAVLQLGIAEKYALDLKEIAIIISSHSGEKEHIGILQQLIEKVGIQENLLECGIHEPINKEAARELLISNQAPSKLHCNCSGKHISLIAASKHLGLPVEGYTKMDHPLQKYIESTISDFGKIDVTKIRKGVDGCGAPVYAIPLENAALAYANICNENFSEGKYRKSQNYVLSAMTMYPKVIAGKGRIDSEIMKRFGDRVVCKIGAEGVYCAGIIGKGIGIAIKIDDGNSRAIGPVFLELLLKLKIITMEEINELKDFWRPLILNNKGENVGEIKASFKIKEIQEV